MSFEIGPLPPVTPGAIPAVAGSQRDGGGGALAMAGLSLSGLASGVDTAGIIEQLMTLERQSLTKIGYRKAAVTGQQDALKEVASKLASLKDAALALSADSTWAQKQTVESSDPARVAVSL